MVSRVSVSDAITVAESVAVSLVNYVSVADSTTVTDFVGYYPDTIWVSETVNMTLVHNIGVYDGISVSDTPQMELECEISVLDLLATSESIAVTSINNIGIYDGIAITEFADIVLPQGTNVKVKGSPYILNLRVSKEEFAVVASGYDPSIRGGLE